MSLLGEVYLKENWIWESRVHIEVLRKKCSPVLTVLRGRQEELMHPRTHCAKRASSWKYASPELLLLRDLRKDSNTSN